MSEEIIVEQEQEYIEVPYNFMYWADNLADETTNWFLEEIRPDSVNRIYMHSNGGDTPVLHTILDIINSSPENFELVATCFLASNAFDLFLLANCDKYILSGFYGGMIHQETFELLVRDYNNPAKIGPLIKDYIEETRKNYRKIYKKFLTKRELKRFDEGDDIYISRERCIKIFNAKEISIFNPKNK